MTDYRIGKGRAVWWFVNFKKICFLDTLYLDGATLLFCWLWYQCTWSIKLCLVVAWFSTSAPWSSSLSTTSVLITLVSFLERHRWSNLAPRRPLKDTLEEAFWPCSWALPCPVYTGPYQLWCTDRQNKTKFVLLLIIGNKRSVLLPLRLKTECRLEAVQAADSNQFLRTVQFWCMTMTECEWNEKARK